MMCFSNEFHSASLTFKKSLLKVIRKSEKLLANVNF